MTPRLTGLHMLLLGWFERDDVLLPEEIARRLGVELALVERLCADLEAAGLIEPAAEH